MKQMFSSAKRVFSLMIMMLVASMTFTLVGCSDDSGRTETPLSDKYSNIPKEATDTFEGPVAIFGAGKKIINVADGSLQDVVKGKDKVRVSNFITPRILFLPKDHPRYGEFYEMLMLGDTKTSDDMKMFKITIYDVSEDGMFPIIDVEKLSPEREAELRKQRQHAKEKVKQRLYETRGTSRSSSGTITYGQAKQFFNEMRDMNCGDYPVCPCIPFQYAADGCYSRAHWMRKEFKEKFGFDCDKVFTFMEMIFLHTQMLDVLRIGGGT